jgi:hypothetical protein
MKEAPVEKSIGVFCALHACGFGATGVAISHGAVLRLGQPERQPAALEIRARPFAAMIEEAIVIVMTMQRHDLALDKGVDLREKFSDVFRNAEVHGRFLRTYGGKSLAFIAFT